MKEILQGKIRPFDHHDEPVCCKENHRYQTPMGDNRLKQRHVIGFQIFLNRNLYFALETEFSTRPIDYT